MILIAHALPNGHMRILANLPATADDRTIQTRTEVEALALEGVPVQAFRLIGGAEASVTAKWEPAR